MTEANDSPSDPGMILCDHWLETLDELNIGAFTVNLGHCITSINYSGQALMGLKANEVIGQDCREIFTGVPCLVNCWIRPKREAEAPETDLEIKDESSATRLITRLATPICDRQQHVVGCLTILQDHSPITDLIDRLQYEERSLKHILDSLDIGVLTINRGGLITFFNTAAEHISGYNRRQVLGQPCSTLFEGVAAADVCRLKDSMDSGLARSNRKGRLVDRDGLIVPVQANYMTLRNEKQKIVGGLITLADMTLVHQLNQAISNNYTFYDMIGKSPCMQRIFEMVGAVADSDATVLIEGPTGTGKDLLAKVIHSASRRADKPLVKINCAAIPENLLESELFGYVKGAFTGADQDKPGRFQAAEGGTLFLDEIGDLPLALQAKLLRVLEDREYYPLGSRRTIKVNARIISATNRGLDKLVADGQFRQDLYYRLNVFRIEIPPLKQRRADLPLLIRHIWRRLSAARGIQAPALSDEVMALLLNHRYPGNIRELENILEHALIVCRRAVVEPQHLPDYVFHNRQTAPAAEPAGDADKPSDDPEKRRILDMLERHHGRRSQAAKDLGIDRTTRWRKMKKHHLLSGRRIGS
jgi:two-component system response regulator HydG